MDFILGAIIHSRCTKLNHGLGHKYQPLKYDALEKARIYCKDLQEQSILKRLVYQVW